MIVTQRGERCGGWGGGVRRCGKIGRAGEESTYLRAIGAHLVGRKGVELLEAAFQRRLGVLSSAAHHSVERSVATEVVFVGDVVFLRGLEC